MTEREAVEARARAADHLELAEKVYRGKIDTHGWAETYLKDVPDLLAENAELRKALELKNAALREIGESAVVDWQDKLVGLVDAALKDDTEGLEYWASAKQYKKRSEAAEAEVVKLREALKSYGSHFPECYKLNNGTDPAKQPCDCGFESALNPGAAKEGENETGMA